MDHIIERIFTDYRPDLVDAWVEGVELAFKTDGMAKESGHFAWMNGFLHLLANHIENWDNRKVHDYVSSIVQKGYLSRFSIGDIIRIFQLLQRAVRNVARIHYNIFDPIPAVSEVMEQITLTACRAYDERLAQAEEKFEALFDNADLLILNISTNGRIEKINQRGSKILGVAPKEIVGKQLTYLVCPDDLPILTRNFGHVLAGNPQIFAIRAIRGSSGFINLDMTMTPVIESGRIVSMRAIARNVTEKIELLERLGKSEEKFRSLIENAGDAILLIALEDGRIMDANSQARKMTGLTLEEICRLSVVDLFDRDDERHVINLLQEAITSGSSEFDELLLLHATKPDTIVEMRSSVIEFAGQKVIQSFLKDVESKRRIEKTLTEQNRRLSEAEGEVAQLRRQLMKLERPAWASQMMLTLIERFSEDLRIEELKGHRASNAEFLDLLDGAAHLLQSATQDRSPVLVEPAMLLARYTKIYKYIYFDRIQFKKELFPVPPILIDPTGLENVLVCLLDSAVQASLAQSDPRISISCHFRGRMVAVEIRDSGKPLTGFEQENIFNPGFEYFDRDPQTLNHARKFLEQYGGGLLLQGIPDAGNIATLFLPSEHALAEGELPDYQMVPFEEKKDTGKGE